MNPTNSILVVGAGTFGLSTAWHAARRGFSVTVIDRHPAPSEASAGADLNKIFRTEYSNPLYSELAVEAREVWLSEETLAGCYKESGYIFSVCGRSAASVKNYEDAVANSRAMGVEFEDLTCPEDFRRKAPFLDGPLDGWRGVFNPRAGWTHASNSLRALTTACKTLGVKFVSGPAGTMKSFITDAAGSVVGVGAEDGTSHLASQTILAAGGWIDSLLDTKGQLLAKGWCFAHIKLTEAEATLWQNAPVVNNRELGYMFEPDAVNHMLKVSPHLPGYTNFETPGRSTPRSKPQHPTDTIPSEAASLIRGFLRECVPSLADRPFSYERICWDADSPDANFLIDKHPQLGNLIVCGGGSAHAFKFLPTIGGYVCDLLEGKLEPKYAEAWKWREGQLPVVDASRPLRPSPDLADLGGWKHDV